MNQKMNQNFEEKICFICHKPFLKRTGVGKLRKSLIRGANCKKTCSKKCAIKYARIRQQPSSIIKQKSINKEETLLLNA